MKKNTRITITLIILITGLTTNITKAETTEENTYNLELKLPEKYYESTPGEEIFFSTKIINLNNNYRKDITLKYEITNKEETYNTQKETVAIETQASFVGEIRIPQNAPEGEYTLKVQVIGENEETHSEASINFKVVDIINYKKLITENIEITTTILTTILTITIIILSRKKIKLFFKKRKINKEIKKMIKEKIRNGQITKKELEESKLAKLRPITRNIEEKIF